MVTDRHRRAFLVMGGACAVFAPLSACSPSSTISLDGAGIGELTQPARVSLNPTQAIFKINKIRARHGLSRISTDTRLMKAARKHARLMARKGRMGHSFGPGTGFQRRMKDVDFEGAAGENLGVGYKSVDAAIQGWMNSPPHRKIMLRRNFDLGGIALAKNPSPGAKTDNFWVLILGSGGGAFLQSAG